MGTITKTKPSSSNDNNDNEHDGYENNDNQMIHNNKIIHIINDVEILDEISTIDGGRLSTNKTIYTHDSNNNKNGFEPSLYSVDYDYTDAIYQGIATTQSVSTSGATGYMTHKLQQPYSVTSYNTNNNTTSVTNDHNYHSSYDDIIPYHNTTTVFNNINSSLSSNTNIITINVPPGKLGIFLADDDDENEIISNNTNNSKKPTTMTLPVVQHIKPNGYLYDKVQVGDKLLSIDEYDTKSMTTEQVCYIISSRSHCNRTFRFLRTFWL